MSTEKTPEQEVVELKKLLEEGLFLWVEDPRQSRDMWAIKVRRALGMPPAQGEIPGSMR